MLFAGAFFTFGLATVMQQRATESTSASYEPGAPPAVAAEKRTDQQWMF